MAATQKLYQRIADSLLELDVVTRVKVFNVLVPVLKEDNPKFSVLMFFLACFEDNGNMKLSFDGKVEKIEGS